MSNDYSKYVLKEPCSSSFPGSSPAAGAKQLMTPLAVSTSRTYRKPATFVVSSWSSLVAWEMASRQCSSSLPGRTGWTRRAVATGAAPAAEKGRLLVSKGKEQDALRAFSVLDSGIRGAATSAAIWTEGCHGGAINILIESCYYGPVQKSE